MPDTRSLSVYSQMDFEQLSAFSHQRSAFVINLHGCDAWGKAGCEMKDFHELKVRRKAHQLTLAVYQITAAFPRDGLYGLTSQLRRCSSSIPANQAEGC